MKEKMCHRQGRKAVRMSSKNRNAILKRNQLDTELYNYATVLFSERYHEMVQYLIEKNSQKTTGEWNPVTGDIILKFGQDIQGQGWYPSEETPGGISPLVRSSKKLVTSYYPGFKV